MSQLVLKPPILLTAFHIKVLAALLIPLLSVSGYNE